MSNLSTADQHLRRIELRYHSGTKCAWGRISNGSPGDSVWVDWAEDQAAADRRQWKQLDTTRIPSGYRQVFTVARDINGDVMRACGKAGNRPEIACTGWATAS